MIKMLKKNNLEWEGENPHRLNPVREEAVSRMKNRLFRNFETPAFIDLVQVDTAVTGIDFSIGLIVVAIAGKKDTR